MENQKQVDNKYNILRAYFEPFYVIRRTRKIIADEERILGESKAKGLLTKISWGWETVKISGFVAAGYHLFNNL